MQRDAHQSTFAARFDIRNDEQRLRSQLPIFENANAPGPLSEYHSAIRRPDYGPGHLQTANYSLNAKLHSALSGGLTLFGLRGSGLDFAGAASRWGMAAGVGKND